MRELFQCGKPLPIEDLCIESDANENGPAANVYVVFADLLVLTKYIYACTVCTEFVCFLVFSSNTNDVVVCRGTQKPLPLLTGHFYLAN